MKFRFRIHIPHLSAAVNVGTLAADKEFLQKFTRPSRSVDSTAKAKCEQECPELVRDLFQNKTSRSVSSLLDGVVGNSGCWAQQ